MLRRLLRILTIAGILALTLLATACFVLRRPSLGHFEDLTHDRARADLLEAHTRFLTTKVVPRGSDNPENLARAANYIADLFEQYSDRVRLQTFPANGSDYHNVIAEFGPHEGPRVVVGAHYDAFTLFGEFPGADDNASGTAGLLELARLLGATQPKLPVTLVAFTLEEPPFYASPLMGSRVHADLLGAEEQEIWGMINLEMIGYFVDEQPWPSWILDLFYPDHGNFIAVVGRSEDAWLTAHAKKSFRGASTIPVFSFNGPVVMGIDASDHRNYWRNGYDAVMVTDTAFMRNPNYHTSSDTADTLDYERMATVVDGVLNTVLQASPRK